MSKMFSVGLVETVTYYVDIEAEDADEAEDKARAEWEATDYDWSYWGEPADSDNQFANTEEHHKRCTCEGCKKCRGISYWTEVES